MAHISDDKKTHTTQDDASDSQIGNHTDDQAPGDVEYYTADFRRNTKSLDADILPRNPDIIAGDGLEEYANEVLDKPQHIPVQVIDLKTQSVITEPMSEDDDALDEVIDQDSVYTTAGAPGGDIDSGKNDD